MKLPDAAGRRRHLPAAPTISSLVNRPSPLASRSTNRSMSLPASAVVVSTWSGETLALPTVAWNGMCTSPWSWLNSHTPAPTLVFWQASTPPDTNRLLSEGDRCLSEFFRFRKVRTQDRRGFMSQVTASP
jgi:hypothetical protein